MLDKKITIKKSEDDNTPERWSIKKCLVAEETLNKGKDNEKTFFLSKGVWYFIEEDFFKEINDNIIKFKCDNPLGEYLDQYNTPFKTRVNNKGKDVFEKGEGLYNLRNSDNQNTFLLDKKCVTISKKPIEICDVYNKKTNTFFHIKRKNSSSSLSHLWNQGIISERVATVEQLSSNSSNPLSEKFKKITNSDLKSDRKIYFGIISNSYELPIFSKISFMNAVYILKSMKCPESNIKYFYIKDHSKKKPLK